MISICFAHCATCGSPDVRDEPCDGCGYAFCAAHADHGCDLAYGIGAEDARVALVAVLMVRVKQRQSNPRISDIGAMINRMAMAYMDGVRTLLKPFVTAFQDMGQRLQNGWRMGVMMRVVMPGYVERARMLRTPALPAPRMEGENDETC